MITDLEERAFAYANKAHGDQKYGEFPYLVHLQHVRWKLEEWGAGSFIRTAGILHDILEDTEIVHDDVYMEFGGTIVDLVFAVTDGEGENRRERKLKVYAKLQDNPQALLIKLADRYCNMNFSYEQFNIDKMEMYLDEMELFKVALYDPSHPPFIQSAWRKLFDLEKYIRKKM